MAKKWDGQTKLTEDLKFTLHYADGSSAEVSRGVLFTINDDDTMDVHVGVSKAWELFGVARCLTELIESLGLIDLFRRYIKEDFGDGT